MKGYKLLNEIREHCINQDKCRDCKYARDNDSFLVMCVFSGDPSEWRLWRGGESDEIRED